ncbi:hypothetical protein LINPERHAP2_LOCUS24716 [Linum perenne]
MSRIDRALVSLDWEDAFTGCLLRAFTRTCSDHCPIVLECAPLRRILRPWRFELMWLDSPDFQDVVRGAWEHPGRGFNGLFCLAAKLKNLKLVLSS